jgi:phospholipid-binding lipoprotein MlaA
LGVAVRGLGYCRLALLAGVVAAGLAGCATAPQDPAARAAFDEANDPLEPFNRGVFAVNRVIDRLLFKPAAEIYRTVLPEMVRDSVRNALNNLDEPVVFANNLLQGEFHRAAFTFDRFVFNSTVGIGGLRDFAGEHGMKRENGDFGQTLYVWGAPEGPYLVLPILGPSNPRDAAGMTMDSYLDPFRYILSRPDPDVLNLRNPNVVRSVVDGIDKRAGVIDELDAIEKTSLDFYAQIRSLSRQNRAKELNHGVAPPEGSTNAPADLYEDPAAAK